MWGSWKLLMFLLRDGTFMLLSMVVLMVLVVVCDSPTHYGDIVQLGRGSEVFALS